MMNDRECYLCGYSAFDLIETQLQNVETSICPMCDEESFTRVPAAPRIQMGSGPLFSDVLDQARQAAANGHGNVSHRL